MTNRYEKMSNAFIPFVMLGDPDIPTSLKIVQTLIDNGADALELGIPFSDPSADGPVLQRAAMRALRAGVTPTHCLQAIHTLRARNPEVPIGLLVYANLVVRPGIDAFYERAALAGVDSVLVADVPTLEAKPFVDAALKYGIDPVLIAPPNASHSQLQEIAKLCKGYTYVVTRKGVTGTNTDLNLSSDKLIQTLRSLGAPPAVLGFGISKPEHVHAAFAQGALGAISGSALAEIIEKSLDNPHQLLETIAQFVRDMKG